MNTPSEILQARIDAEAVLLAAILIDGGDGGHEVIDYCRTRLQPSDFLKEHQRIYAAMLAAANCDVVTVPLEMKRRGTLESGVLSYLSHIISQCESYRLYKHYVDAVVSNHSARPTINGGIAV